jgi:hypothetical protein
LLLCGWTGFVINFVENQDEKRLLDSYNKSLTTQLNYGRMKTFVISIFLSFLFASCATIGSTGIYHIPITTVPADAEIRVYDQNDFLMAVMSSPDTLSLKPSSGYFKRAEYYVHISKNGYQPSAVPVYFVMDRKYLLNICTAIFMPIGLLLVDPVSGAMWKPEKQSFEVTLVKKME